MDAPRTSPRAMVGPNELAASVYVVDLEGTLVDTVLPSLTCWCETLAEAGLNVRTADLHRYAGVTAGEMLAQVLPDGTSVEDQEYFARRFQERYEAQVLPTTRVLLGARSLLPALKQRGARVAVV
jgi:beta-phosphoglucomutase-like phosphatase (HAD superfamily)